MDMEKTKMSFEVDANQIDIRPMLKKDFLELSMKAISSANPNRNNSWFTEESMERSKGTFVNKPILGYFENGDFVSHNGSWRKDSETEMDYWDTLGQRGERILGTIRESDEIKIIKDKKGLSWITFTCMLWTQYSFKQVKRLIKDAKRAAKEGGSTKNISVEVDITDYEMLPNGVMKINEFNLVGVTILGSRNGVKVEPGIEDAELSVIDVMGRDVYEKQQKALKMAYERLGDSGKNERKEEFQMETEEPKICEEQIEDETVHECDACVEPMESEPVQEEEAIACPECGKNPCECPIGEEPKAEADGEEPVPAEEAADPICREAETEKEPEPEPSEPEEPEDDSDDEGEDGDDEDKDDDGERDDGEEKTEEEPKAEDPRVAELTKQCEDLMAARAELEERCMKLESDCAAKCAECESIRAELESRSDYDELKAKVKEYEHASFMSQADALLASSGLDEGTRAQFRKECDEGIIASGADLRIKVALAVFQMRENCGEARLSIPATNPAEASMFSAKPNKKKKASDDCWENLREEYGAK